jgi:RNA polymerase sigma factor (sigma-70 family)
MTDRPFRRLLGLVRRAADADGPAPDERLLERFAAERDEAAFEVLVWRHGPMVLGVCRRVLGDAHAAEDAFQATFLALARQARSVRRGTALAGWLHRVARRVALRARHAAARRTWHERRAAVSGIAAGEPAGDLRAVLDEELDRLPARLRLPVVLCYLEGRSTAEAARRIGCPRGTVLSRLAAARSKLRARLVRRGLAPAAGGLAALAAPANAPAALVAATVRAALAFAAGRVGALGAAAPGVIALTEGVLRTMLISKLTCTAAVVLAVGVLGTGAGLVAWPTAGPGSALARAEGPQPKAAAPKAEADDKQARAPVDPVPPAPRPIAEIERAGAALRQGQIDEALKLLQEATTKHPNLPPARLMLARLFLAMPQHQQQGRITLELAAVENSDHPEVFLTLASLALKDGRITECSLDLQKALDLSNAEHWTPERKKAIQREIQAGLAAANDARVNPKPQPPEADQVRNEVAKLEEEQKVVEDQLTKRIIDARLAVLMAEEEVRRVTEEWTAQGALLNSRLQRADEAVAKWGQFIREYQSKTPKPGDDPTIKAYEKNLREAVQERDDTRQTAKETAEKWSERVLEARKKGLIAEEMLKLEERRAASQRQRMQSRIDALSARLAQLQDRTPRPAAAPERRLADLERKLDELLGEVKELRRELRK